MGEFGYTEMQNQNIFLNLCIAFVYINQHNLYK
jgi:hypothetical protein